MCKKLVSIIIPMYNVEKYLEDCLESVVNQTFQDIEIICVDDASTDKTLSIARSIAETDNRILVLQNDRNRGQSYARNKGMSVANGKYLYFLDSDDMITENAIEELWNKAEKNELDVIFFDGKVIYENESLREKFRGYRMQHLCEYLPVMSGKEAFNAMLQNKEWVVIVQRQFWRKKFLDDNQIRFENGIIHEDELFSTLAIMQVRRCSVEKEQYVIRRFRKNSTMTSAKSQKNLNGYFRCLCKLIEYMGNHIEETRDYPKIDHYLNIIKDYISGFLSDHRDWEINVQDPLEFAIRKMLELEMYEVFSKQDIEKLRMADEVLIYGAGKAASRIFGELLTLNISPKGFVVTSKANNAESLFGLPIEEASQCASMQSAVVIVAIKNREQIKEVQNLLSEYGTENVIVPWR